MHHWPDASFSFFQLAILLTNHEFTFYMLLTNDSHYWTTLIRSAFFFFQELANCHRSRRCHEMLPCCCVLHVSLCHRQAKIQWTHVGLHRSEPRLSGHPSPISNLQKCLLCRPAELSGLGSFEIQRKHCFLNLASSPLDFWLAPTRRMDEQTNVSEWFNNLHFISLNSGAWRHEAKINFFYISLTFSHDMPCNITQPLIKNKWNNE